MSLSGGDVEGRFARAVGRVDVPALGDAPRGGFEVIAGGGLVEGRPTSEGDGGAAEREAAGGQQQSTAQWEDDSALLHDASLQFSAFGRPLSRGTWRVPGTCLPCFHRQASFSRRFFLGLREGPGALDSGAGVAHWTVSAEAGRSCGRLGGGGREMLFLPDALRDGDRKRRRSICGQAAHRGQQPARDHPPVIAGAGSREGGLAQALPELFVRA